MLCQSILGSKKHLHQKEFKEFVPDTCQLFKKSNLLVQRTLSLCLRLLEKKLFFATCLLQLENVTCNVCNYKDKLQKIVVCNFKMLCATYVVTKTSCKKQFFY
jgi:hypothetical protein